MHQCDYFCRDGSKILTSSDDGSARLWSSETGFELTKIVFEIMDEAARSNVLSQLQSSAASHDGPVAGAALSPDSALIATCSSLDHSIQIWNAKTGQRTEWPKSFAAHHIGTVTSMQFCNATMLMTSSLDGSVQLWAALTGQRTKVFNGHACMCLAVQPSIPDFFLEMSEPVIRSILVTQHEAVLATLTPHAAPALIPFGRDFGGVTDATFSPSGSYFAASHENGSCTVYSSAGGAPLWQLIGHTGRINCVVCAGSDRFIVTCGRDKMVNFWQLPVNPSKSAPCLLHPILSLPFDLEVARIAAVKDLLVFVSVDAHTSSHLPCVGSDGALNLGGSLSLCFDSGVLKYLFADLNAGGLGPSKNGPFSRYLLPPVWMIESVLASSHNVAKERLRCLLQGPAAGKIRARAGCEFHRQLQISDICPILGAIALHERLSRPSLLASMASKGNTESLSFLLRLQAPGVPFLVGRLFFSPYSHLAFGTYSPWLVAAGPLLFAAVNGATQHKSDCVALILRHFSSKISVPGEFPFFTVERDNICAAIIKAFADS